MPVRAARTQLEIELCPCADIRGGLDARVGRARRQLGAWGDNWGPLRRKSGAAEIIQEEGKCGIEELRTRLEVNRKRALLAQQLVALREMSSVPSSPTFGVADDASSVLRAAAADAAEARRLAQMARQTSELVLRQAAQVR